jgi:uncharacterized protein
MATSLAARAEVFLDTSFAIALISPRDHFHNRAKALADQAEKGRWQLVTTEAVLFEMGNALSRQRHRDAAVALIRSLREDPSVEVLPTTVELLDVAFGWFALHRDKEWSLTDCLSFVVMQRRKLGCALTADHHFVQAGYEALLLG